jgi:tetratricopeptide (TPR) repeat protein
MKYLKSVLLVLVVVTLWMFGVKADDVSPEHLQHLLEEGQKTFEADDYPTALEKWQVGLRQANTLGDKYYVSRFLSKIGIAHINLSQDQQALDYFQQALVLTREIGNHKRNEGSDLNNIGATYFHLDQYQKALDYFQQALTIYREISDRNRESITLYNIGQVYDNLEQHKKALDFFQKSLVIFREIGDNRGEDDIFYQYRVISNNRGEGTRKISDSDIPNEGSILSDIGKMYLKLNQYRNALDYYQQALDIHRKLGDNQEKAYDLFHIGSVYGSFYQNKKALDYYLQAVAIFQKIKNKQAECASLSNIGAIYNTLDQYKTALEYSQQALAISRNINDRKAEKRSLNNIGISYKNLGQYQNAMVHIKQSLDIAREIDDKEGEGVALSMLGTVYRHIGQYQKALDYSHQAWVILQEFGNKDFENVSHSNIGRVYMFIGQYQKALDHFHQALAIAREIGNRDQESNNLADIGAVYLQLGYFQKALDYSQQALIIHQEIADMTGEASTLNNTGMIYSGWNEYRKALEHYHKSLLITREFGQKLQEGQIMTNIGLVYYALEQYPKANKVFKKSTTIFETLGSYELWKAQRGMASTEVHLSQPELAIAHYQQALDNIESQRAGLTEKIHKFAFISDKLHVYDELIALLQSLHSKHPKKGYARKAIETFERKQGRVFLEEMGQSGARRFTGIPEEITQKEQELVQQISLTRKKRTEALEKDLDAEPHRQRLEKLEAEQQTFDKTLKTNYPAYYALKYPQPVDLATLQNQVLREGEMVLVYGVMEENTVLWIVGKQYFQMLNLDISEEELQAKVEAFRASPNTLIDAIETQPPDEISKLAKNNLPQLRQAGYELYQSLIPAKIKTSIKDAHTLYIVPTGPLYSLPFGALDTHNPTQHDTPHYLIQNYSIVYLSSASLLKTIRDTERDEKSDRYPFLAFADPEYPKKCPLKPDNVTEVIQTARTEAYLKLAGSGENGCFIKEDELKDTKKQAEAIAKLFNAPQDSDPLQLREKASRSNVFKFNYQKRLDDYRYLLFAAHAILPEETSNVTQPAIVLSHPELEGYLTMADVFGLKMNADFVMLSACNTGRGEKIKGEGVRGLTRAFMYAGTPAVSVSLWYVESISAKNLSVGLFEHLQQGKSLAQALRQSKLDLIMADEEMDMYQHPYFWAPFVVFGDGS